jgi:DegV family protein with EDD domain
MSIRFVIDSTADLPEEILTRLGIVMVPMYLNLDGTSYKDRIEISRKEFYERLPHAHTFPTTSSPSLESFTRAYHSLAEEGATQIISIHLPSAFSNGYSTAQSAAREFKDVPVTVVESGQLSMGAGLIIKAAAEAARDGAGLEDVLEVIREVGERTYVFVMLDTLEYLRRSGRASGFKSRLGVILGVKPVISLHLGKLTFDLARTRSRVHRRLLELLESISPLEHLSVGHTNSLDRVDELRQLGKDFFPVGEESYTLDVTPLIGTHIGPNAGGYFCLAKRR